MHRIIILVVARGGRGALFLAVACIGRCGNQTLRVSELYITKETADLPDAIY
jgi:hypothetical protein